MSSKVRFTVIKLGNGLYPVDEPSKEVFDGIRQNRQATIEFSDGNDRSAKNLSRFFVFIKTAFAMQDCYMDKEDFRKDILRHAGHVRTWYDYNGNRQEEVKSISFAELSDEDTFRALFKRCVDAFEDMYSVINGHDLNIEEFIDQLGEIERFR